MGSGYAFLHKVCADHLIPQIQQAKNTLAIIELTTCGLISDLLTGISGASQYFLLGMVPYSTEVKEKLGVSPSLLTHDGPGTVSRDTAQAMAEYVRSFSQADIGIAETGLLTSSSLTTKRTKKTAGTVFLSIVSKKKIQNDHFQVNSDLNRRIMRLEIAGHIILSLYTFLDSILEL